MAPIRVAHLTSAHPRYDTRIFLKQCVSLATAGYDTKLIVADGHGHEVRDGVEIIDVGQAKGRLGRMMISTLRVLGAARRLHAQIYHIHDPELWPAGIVLKALRKKVIFDAHEDLPEQILGKTYIRLAYRRPMARLVAFAERVMARRVDCVVAATPFIRDKFLRHGASSVDIRNYPLLGELSLDSVRDVGRPEVCYVGGISLIRGIAELVSALAVTKNDVRLNLAGQFADARSRDSVASLAGWSRVNELGFVSRTDVASILSRSIAGLVTLHPTTAFVTSLPIKMFEYMSAGLPVIASDFPLWRQIINDDNCGICVDPMSPPAIAAAIDQLASEPNMARAMGENGRRAVLERYNWGVEEKKLLELYSSLFSSG